MAMWHTLQPGETLASVAEAHGLPDWQCIYEAPENEELRELRPDPQDVQPGDAVYLPGEDEEEEEPGLEFLEFDEQGTMTHFGHDEGQEGQSGLEEYELAPLEEEVARDSSLPAEGDAKAMVHPVCRNLMNTIDTRPGGFHWFSA